VPPQHEHRASAGEECVVHRHHFGHDPQVRQGAASGRASASNDARHHRQAVCHHQTVARAAGFTAARQVRGQTGTFMAGNEMSRPGSRLKRKKLFPGAFREKDQSTSSPAKRLSRSRTAPG
jgi:hypothetical protein